jgi:hypothetical protein
MDVHLISIDGIEAARYRILPVRPPGGRNVPSRSCDREQQQRSDRDSEPARNPAHAKSGDHATRSSSSSTGKLPEVRGHAGIVGSLWAEAGAQGDHPCYTGAGALLSTSADLVRFDMAVSRCNINGRDLSIVTAPARHLLKCSFPFGPQTRPSFSVADVVLQLEERCGASHPRSDETYLYRGLATGCDRRTVSPAPTEICAPQKAFR